MPLEPEALQTRLLHELSSMPESVSRVAVDALYTAFALRRNEYPSTGIYVVDEVIMACAPFWLNVDSDGLSNAIRIHTLSEISDWVNWVERQTFQTVIMISSRRTATALCSSGSDPDPLELSDPPIAPNLRNVFHTDGLDLPTVMAHSCRQPSYRNTPPTRSNVKRDRN